MKDGKNGERDGDRRNNIQACTHKMTARLNVID